MKKSCNRCKALSIKAFDTHFSSYECELGHKIDEEKRKPLEECEKPLTNKKYIEIMKG